MTPGACGPPSFLGLNRKSGFRDNWYLLTRCTTWRRPGTPSSATGAAGSLLDVTVLAADTTLVVAGLVFVLGVAVLVLLVWAPWNSVRNEPPLPDDVETRLLLGEDPEQIAADEDAAERRARRAAVIDLSPDDDGDDLSTSV